MDRAEFEVVRGLGVGGVVGATWDQGPFSMSTVAPLALLVSSMTLLWKARLHSEESRDESIW